MHADYAHWRFSTHHRTAASSPHATSSRRAARASRSCWEPLPKWVENRDVPLCRPAIAQRSNLGENCHNRIYRGGRRRQLVDERLRVMQRYLARTKCTRWGILGVLDEAYRPASAPWAQISGVLGARPNSLSVAGSVVTLPLMGRFVRTRPCWYRLCSHTPMAMRAGLFAPFLVVFFLMAVGV